MSLLLRAKKYTEIARDQGGVFTLTQALAAGLNDQFIRGQVAADVLFRVSPGIYAVSGTPPTFSHRLWAACLEADGVVSHRTAGWLWRFDGLHWSNPQSKCSCLTRIAAKRPRRE